jgi:hypothetical protein
MTDNIMAKGKLTKTDNIMDKGKLTKTDNIRAKGKLTKDRQYHGQKEADKRQFPFVHDIVCLLSVSLWP